MSRIRLIDHNVVHGDPAQPGAAALGDGLWWTDCCSRFAGVATIWLAFLVVKASIRPGWPMLLLVVFWVLLTYLLLPRLHRILTGLYVPGYFIGRARTSDGLLGDPVNLALLGHEAQIHTAMTRAGWTRADDLSFRTGLRIFTSTLRRRSYHEAPVSPLHLFDRQQDFAYQQEVAGSPSKRHHVRFWRCPEDWMLPGGYSVDWLAAGTYDKSVGLSLFTLAGDPQDRRRHRHRARLHRRDVKKGSPEVDVEVIDNFSTGYHSRNGGGDLIITDGDLPIINVRHIDVPRDLQDRTHRQPRQAACADRFRGRGGIFPRTGVLAHRAGAVLLADEVRPVARSFEGGRPALIMAGSVVAFIGLD